MTIPITIRKMVPADVPVIGEILGASPQAAQWDMRQFVQPEWPQMDLLVAEQDGTVIAVLAARSVADEAEILNLAVTPDQRRQGIGGLLVSEVIAASQRAGVKSVFLEVRESNAAARAFYAGLNFAESGRRRAYYRDPVEDALVLSLKLP